MFKSLFDKVSKKVIVCPNCGQRSRVPVKPGKSLLITCPSCKAKFEIKFEDPISSAKKQFQNPLDQLIVGLQPAQKEKIKKYFPFIIAITIVLLMRTCFSTPSSAPSYQEKPTYQNNNQVKDSTLFDM